MSKRRRLLNTTTSASLAALGAAIAMHPGAALAQSSPSQVPPGPDAATESRTDPFAFPQAQGTSAPAGAESVRFTLRAVYVENDYPEVRRRTEEVLAPHIGQEITVAEFYDIAREIQGAYFDAGYPLVRIVVPPQTVEMFGHPRLLLVDGYIERIDVSQVPSAARTRVEHVLRSLVGSERPTAAQIERKLLIAGDTVGLRLRTILTPGSTTGAAVLVLMGEHEETDFAVSVDNRVPEDLGGYQVTGSVAFNSVFGAGEQVYATYAGYPDEDWFSDEARRRYAVVGGTLPLGDNGLTVSVALEYSSTRPTGDLAALELGSEYFRGGVNLAFPTVRSLRHNLLHYVAFDATSETQATHIVDPEITLSEDRTRVLRFGLQGSSSFSKSGVSYGAELSRGLDALGARSASEATILKPLSRMGADADFTKFEGRFEVRASPASGMTLRASARAQASFGEPLLRSEQFSPIDDRGISGAPPGTLVGDSGAVLRLEYEQAFGQAGGMVVAPYVFTSGARVELSEPTVLEEAHTEVSEAGAGIRLAIPTADGERSRATASLEWSRVQSDDDEIDRDWMSFRITARF